MYMCAFVCIRELMCAFLKASPPSDQIPNNSRATQRRLCSKIRRPVFHVGGGETMTYYF